MRTLVVVSGGDAPGINTVLARLVQVAEANQDEVYGVQGGFPGVLSQQIDRLKLSTVLSLAGLGGTLLPSSREPVLSEDGAQERLQQVLDTFQIDNVLLFGGNGTLYHVLPILAKWQIPTIALPTTIDNDVAGTERTLGFDSACNFAYRSVEGILATAHALQGRHFMLETLGGDTGYLALQVAFGAGADAVLVPEYDFSVDWLVDRLKTTIDRQGYGFVVLSEGVQDIDSLERELPQKTGIRLRFSRLGHAQRGGKVTHIDRVLAHEMVRLAYGGFKDNVACGAVIVKDGVTQLHEGILPLVQKEPPDRDMYNTINGLV